MPRLGIPQAQKGTDLCGEAGKHDCQGGALALRLLLLLLLLRLLYSRGGSSAGRCGERIVCVGPHGDTS